MDNERGGDFAPAGDALPYVTIKYAQTLDGRIATSSGESRWISSEDSLAFAHRLRASHDAILVGIGTVLIDDPRLTVRLVDGNSPLRIVVDSRLRTPVSANVLSDGGAHTTVFGVTSSAPRERIETVRQLGAKVVVSRSDDRGRVDLVDFLHQLRIDGIRSLMVEGGGRIITSLLGGRLVNRVVICIAPKMLGKGVEAVGELGATTLLDAVSFSSFSYQSCGDDMLFDGEVLKPPAGRLSSSGRI